MDDVVLVDVELIVELVLDEVLVDVYTVLLLLVDVLETVLLLLVDVLETVLLLPSCNATYDAVHAELLHAVQPVP